MATDIPPAITIPDKFDTRLGTLRFKDGFPDDATVQKVYDDLDFQRGVQAFLTAMPAASLSAMREGLKGVGVNNSSVVLIETLMDSKSLFLTANTESIYVVGWLDLKDGPLVLETPPHVLGFVNDFWFHYVTDMGNAGPDKGKGGKFLFLPPGYQGEVPEGYFVSRPSTFGNWLVGRGFHGERRSQARGREHQGAAPHLPAGAGGEPARDTSSTPPARRSTPSMRWTSRSLKRSTRSCRRNRRAMEPETLGLLAAIGIEKGKPFAPDERMRKILDRGGGGRHRHGADAHVQVAHQGIAALPDGSWGTAFVGGSYEFLHNGAGCSISYSSFFFVPPGSRPRCPWRWSASGRSMPAPTSTPTGRPLDGGRTYKLTLPAGIPAKDFWSLVLYDTQTRSELQTDQQFPSLGSQKAGVAVNADSSVDVYFGPKAPPGKESNWVQTMPGKGWFVILRLYGPLQPWFDKTWQPGEIEEVK